MAATDPERTQEPGGMTCLLKSGVASAAAPVPSVAAWVAPAGSEGALVA
jgi:hypothetical protein